MQRYSIPPFGTKRFPNDDRECTSRTQATQRPHDTCEDLTKPRPRTLSPMCASHARLLHSMLCAQTAVQNAWLDHGHSTMMSVTSCVLHAQDSIVAMCRHSNIPTPPSQ